MAKIDLIMYKARFNSAITAHSVLAVICLYLHYSSNRVPTISNTVNMFVWLSFTNHVVKSNGLVVELI